VDTTAVTWLRSEAGTTATHTAAGLLAAGLTELAVRQRLDPTITAEQARAVLGLLAGRRALRDKFTAADQLFADREAAEQAAHEVVAAHTAVRFAGCSLVADLGCGMGADTLALARCLGASGGAVLAVDRDPGRLAMVRANAAVLRLSERVRLQQADIDGWELPADIDGVWLDPARRDGSGRRTHPEAWAPPLSRALALAANVPRAGVKVAPGIELRLLDGAGPAPWEIEFVSLNRSLRAAVLWLGAAVTTPRRATILEPSGIAHTLTGDAGEGPARVAPPGGWLYDPDPAVGRAGLVRQLAHDLAAWQLDARTAYLSSDEAIATPFARQLRILAALPFSERGVLTAAREAGCVRIEVERRASPVDTNALERRLNAGLPGGAGRVGTVALTHAGRQHLALLCEAEVPG